jgi:Flp pilus assembly CpaF family ATPase
VLSAEISDRNPSLSGKLPLWGARVQASITPVVEAPSSRSASRRRSSSDYLARGIITAAQDRALRAAVAGRENILGGGGTGSGKTTFLNALLREVARTEDRVYLVEDTPELQCSAPNKLQVLVHPPTYTWNRAIFDAIRPDRIIVGEARGGAALELRKAWNTGHPGGLATLRRTTPLRCWIDSASWSKKSFRSHRDSSSRRRSPSAFKYSGTITIRLADL